MYKYSTVKWKEIGKARFDDQSVSCMSKVYFQRVIISKKIRRCRCIHPALVQEGLKTISTEASTKFKRRGNQRKPNERRSRRKRRKEGEEGTAVEGPVNYRRTLKNPSVARGNSTDGRGGIGGSHLHDKYWQDLARTQILSAFYPRADKWARV